MKFSTHSSLAAVYSVPGFAGNAITNEIIALLKETALISTIGESDIMRRANIVAAENYTYLQPLLVAALCYYLLILLLSSVAKLIERKFNLYSCAGTKG